MQRRTSFQLPKDGIKVNLRRCTVRKGKRKIVVTPEVGDAREYLIPKGKNITVHEGDFVRAGEAIRTKVTPVTVYAAQGETGAPALAIG